jgi:glyoxylase I family protein
MERVQGFGGYFFRAQDPELLGAWYETHLGITAMSGETVWQQKAGPTVFAPFPADTEYFGRATQSVMVNFRVDDLDKIVAQLEAAGVKTEDVYAQDGIGRFTWAADPEGNRFELWEPAPEVH